MYILHKATLPPNELGDDRCLQMNYYGHGDIMVSTWSGHLEFKPEPNDGHSTRFGFAHGCDSLILASLAGYLKRLGRSDDHVRGVLHDAGRDVLQDMDYSLEFHRPQSMVRRVSRGEASPHFDVPQQNLACLALPMPAHPGVLQEMGGTGIYTRHAGGTTKSLVLAKHVPVTTPEGRRTTEIRKTADFYEPDVPGMARLVCQMALGEYRRDLRALLTSFGRPDEAE